VGAEWIGQEIEGSNIGGLFWHTWRCRRTHPSLAFSSCYFSSILIVESVILIYVYNNTRYLLSPRPSVCSRKLFPFNVQVWSSGTTGHVYSDDEGRTNPNLEDLFTTIRPFLSHTFVSCSRARSYRFGETPGYTGFASHPWLLTTSKEISGSLKVTAQMPCISAPLLSRQRIPVHTQRSIGSSIGVVFQESITTRTCARGHPHQFEAREYCDVVG